MFDTTLIASNPGREVRRKLATLPAALAVHGLALGAVMAGQLWAVQPVEQPDVVVAFVDAAPPSPPPAPPQPPKGGGASAATKPAEPKTPAEPVQPRVVPAEPAKAGPPESTGEPGDVVGGGDNRKGVGVPYSVGTDLGRTPPSLVLDDTPVGPGAGIVLPGNVYRTDHVYPELARRARIQGTVVVEATIDRQGNVVDTRLLRDPGLGCGAAVVAALRTWKYRPATFNDKPVSIIMTVTVTFRLAGTE